MFLCWVFSEKVQLVLFDEKEWGRGERSICNLLVFTQVTISLNTPHTYKAFNLIQVPTLPSLPSLKIYTQVSDRNRTWLITLPCTINPRFWCQMTDSIHILEIQLGNTLFFQFDIASVWCHLWENCWKWKSANCTTVPSWRTCRVWMSLIATQITRQRMRTEKR